MAQGKIISFDPNYRPTLWGDLTAARKWILAVIRNADILKVSEEEMELVTGQKDAQVGSLHLLEMGSKAVFVTMGEQGCYYRNSASYGLAPAYAAKAIDTTGAGDAFWGATLWQLKEHTLPEIELQYDVFPGNTPSETALRYDLFFSHNTRGIL